MLVQASRMLLFRDFFNFLGFSYEVVISDDLVYNI